MKQHKCDFCGKVIEGYRDSQVDHLMMIHVMSKHREEFMNKEDFIDHFILRQQAKEKKSGAK